MQRLGSEQKAAWQVTQEPKGKWVQSAPGPGELGGVASQQFTDALDLYFESKGRN